MNIYRFFFSGVQGFLEKNGYAILPLSQLQELQKYKTWVPPGHFYSPIPSKEEIAAYGSFTPLSQRQLEEQGIHFHLQKQRKLYQNMLPFLQEIKYSAKKRKHSKGRYFFQNGNFEYFDGSVLYAMLRFLQPKRVIEIGSGYSTCVMLDVLDRPDQSNFSFTSIEPYPELLRSLLKKSDLKKHTLLQKRVQDVPLTLFEDLEAGDILFIDSTHVSKLHSDVNAELFRILPRLKKGVYIHFHDIFHTFEYPKEWHDMGIAWNELYMLQAFLAYNRHFSIRFFNNFFVEKNTSLLQKTFPTALKNPGGSLWLQKTL